MRVRSSSKVVIFTRPFRLGGVVGEQPAGSYTVETDEEPLDSVSITAYRRIATAIRLPLPSGAAGCSQTIAIDPAELEQALARDAAPQPR
jgi:hypothetical protein